MIRTNSIFNGDHCAMNKYYQPIQTEPSNFIKLLQNKIVSSNRGKTLNLLLNSLLEWQNLKNHCGEDNDLAAAKEK